MTSIQRLIFCFAVLLLGATPPALAATFCVKTSAEFQSALNTAASNASNDNIFLTTGTYAVGAQEFVFNSSEAYSLRVTGGFGTDCFTQTRNAALTVLDGLSQSQILNLTTSNIVELHFLTLQNGSRSGSSGGAMQVDGIGNASQVLLANNIIRNSSSDYGVSGAIFSVAGTVTLQGNLVTGNTGPGGPIYIGGETRVAVHLTSNTVVGNAADPGSPAIVYVGAGSDVPMDASNNIFWSNTGAPDLDFVGGTMLLMNNDYQRIDATLGDGSSGNLSVDPQFVSTTHFHLRATSPLLGIGTLVPPGGLTDFDLDGHNRISHNAIDLGAYENEEGIFADGFEM